MGGGGEPTVIRMSKIVRKNDKNSEEKTQKKKLGGQDPEARKIQKIEENKFKGGEKGQIFDKLQEGATRGTG